MTIIRDPVKNMKEADGIKGKQADENIPTRKGMTNVKLIQLCPGSIFIKIMAQFSL